MRYRARLSVSHSGEYKERGYSSGVAGCQPDESGHYGTVSNVKAIGPALLFVSADQPKRVLNASQIADITVVDLEDAVAPEARANARRKLLEISTQLDPARTIVRISPVETADFALDLATVLKTSISTCMLAKTESPDQLALAAPLQIIALCETPLGVVNATSIAATDSCAGMMWGSEDLALELGMSNSRPKGHLSPSFEFARYTVLFAAKAYGKASIDAVFPDFRNDAGFRSETIQAVEAGFDAKACVHPGQLDTVREAFLPGVDDLTWASNVIAEASLRNEAVFEFNGSMVDAPVIRRAQSILARSHSMTRSRSDHLEET